MFRSPMSPASFCTSTRSSSRNAISSGESGPAVETFFPGILIPNHQSNAKITATAMVMRRGSAGILLAAADMLPAALWRRIFIPSRSLTKFHVGVSRACPATCRTERATCPRSQSSRDLLPKLQRAKNEQKVRHKNQNKKILPVFEEICAAQNDRPHQRDEVRRWEERTERIKNPRHCFAWKNEA